MRQVPEYDHHLNFHILYVHHIPTAKSKPVPETRCLLRFIPDASLTILIARSCMKTGFTVIYRRANNDSEQRCSWPSPGFTSDCSSESACTGNLHTFGW